MRYEYKIDSKLFLQEQNWQYGMPGMLYVRGEFSPEMAEYFIDELRTLCNTGQEIIPVIINSPGGDVYSLIEMVDALESCNRKVLTYISGHAMSAGAFLAACGDKGLRYASPNSDIMVHQVSSGIQGKTEDLSAYADATKRVNDHLFKMLDKKTGHKNGYWKSLLKSNDHADLYLSPKKALEHNLINHIGTPTMQIEVNVNIKVK